MSLGPIDGLKVTTDKLTQQVKDRQTGGQTDRGTRGQEPDERSEGLKVQP